MIGSTVQCSQLVHEAPGDARRAHLRVERNPRDVEGRGSEAGRVGQREHGADGQRGARREPGAQGDGR